MFIEGNADYAIPAGAISNTERLRKLSAFFFWTSWSAAANRPGDMASYTNNWPHEPLVGNRPTGDNVVWTGVSIIMLLAGISAMAWWYASRKEEDETAGLSLDSDPLARWESTPSQKATIKYFWVVAALILVQMGLGRRDSTLWCRRRRLLRISRFRTGCPTASRVRGISKWACSGSPRPGWQPACSSARWSAITNRKDSDWASTCCLVPCCWSWSDRSPASGSASRIR